MTDKAPQFTDSTFVWHYRQFAEFVSILQTQSLWFSRLDKLRDPFEGRSEHPYKSKLRTIAENHDRKGCVNCWAIGDSESELMWYAFAPTYGIALRSTKGNLKRSFKEPDKNKIVLGAIEYGTDWFKGEPESYAFKKRRGFRHEEELRAYIPYEYELGSVVEPTYAGRLVAVDLQILISEVWVHPSSPDWFPKVVEAEIEKYGFAKVPVERRT